MNKKNPSLYRRIFCDIVRGHSVSSIWGERVYIKHLTTHDQVDLEDIEESFFKKAKKRGVATEEESLDSLMEDGTWTKEDALFLETQESYVRGLISSKSQLMLKSQLDQQDKLIKEEQKKLDSKLSEKDGLLGPTCEKYAKQRLNDHYISRSFFLDSPMETPMYTEKEFEEVSYKKLAEMIKIHNEQFHIFSEENIQQTVLEEFFFPYMPFGEDTVQFFGQPAALLTHNQLKLILFTRVFKSILDHNEDIPEHIKKDPKALLDYASTSKKGREELERHQEKGGASTIVGATAEDYEYMGVQAKGTSLHEAAKKKGGSLGMDDLMNLTGS